MTEREREERELDAAGERIDALLARVRANREARARLLGKDKDAGS